MLRTVVASAGLLSWLTRAGLTLHSLPPLAVYSLPSRTSTYDALWPAYSDLYTPSQACLGMTSQAACPWAKEIESSYFRSTSVPFCVGKDLNACISKC